MKKLKNCKYSRRNLYQILTSVSKEKKVLVFALLLLMYKFVKYFKKTNFFAT